MSLQPVGHAAAQAAVLKIWLGRCRVRQPGSGNFFVASARLPCLAVAGIGLC